MKTPEDEAFDELARKQGMWGGGFTAKRAMAADKLQDGKCKYCVDGCIACDARAQPAQERHGYDWSMLDAAQKSLCEHMAHIKELEEALAQPAQEPVARVTGVYGGRFTYDPINRAMVLPIGMALYAAAPQRPWKKLTEEERASFEAANPKTQKEWNELFDGIEAKLKKNT